MKYDNHLAEHIRLIDAVNNSATIEEHAIEEAFLNGWRRGLQTGGGFFSVQEIYRHYADLGIKHPNIVGVWLDWIPEV